MGYFKLGNLRLGGCGISNFIGVFLRFIFTLRQPMSGQLQRYLLNYHTVLPAELR